MKSAITALVVALAMGAAASPSCPPQGDSTVERIRALDLLKNRDAAPVAINHDITLAAILASGDDTTRFSPEQGAVIEGYVALVKRGGAESCHCHQSGIDKEDAHIALVADPKDASNNKRHVIVEVTPQFRPPLSDINTLRKLLKVGTHVRVIGYMFFDAEHFQNAANTMPGGGNVWRASAWEIHPVTGIEVIP